MTRLIKFLQIAIILFILFVGLFLPLATLPKDTTDCKRTHVECHPMYIDGEFVMVCYQVCD